MEKKMKAIYIEPDELKALVQFYRITIDLESIPLKLNTAVDENEEKQILCKQGQLVQERLQARKILEPKIFIRYIMEDQL